MAPGPSPNTTPGRGSCPGELGPVFGALAEAEWAVFKLRWKRHTGQDLLLD